MIKKLSIAVPELLFRFIIGFVFIESGWGKLHNLEKVTAFFESLHIPFASLQAPFVSCVELFGGLFILFGVLTRLTALPLIGVMVVAIITAKSEDVTSVSSLLGTSEFLYLAILVYLAGQGAKVLAVDNYISKPIDSLISKILKKKTA